MTVKLDIPDPFQQAPKAGGGGVTLDIPDPFQNRSQTVSKGFPAPSTPEMASTPQSVLTRSFAQNLGDLGAELYGRAQRGIGQAIKVKGLGDVGQTLDRWIPGSGQFDEFTGLTPEATQRAGADAELRQPPVGEAGSTIAADERAGNPPSREPGDRKDTGTLPVGERIVPGEANGRGAVAGEPRPVADSAQLRADRVEEFEQDHFAGIGDESEAPVDAKTRNEVFCKRLSTAICRHINQGRSERQRAASRTVPKEELPHAVDSRRGATTRATGTRVMVFRPTDELRNRAASSAQARSQRLRPKGIRENKSLSSRQQFTDSVTAGLVANGIARLPRGSNQHPSIEAPSQEQAAKLSNVGRTNEDKRRSVLTLLNDSEWAAWSDSEIARKCGVGHDMVASHRPKSSLAGNASEKTYTTKNGTTAKRGRQPQTPHTCPDGRMNAAQPGPDKRWRKAKNFAQDVAVGLPGRSFLGARARAGAGVLMPIVSI